ncbi:unnamed protein product [Effrenium voratum]|nr:unnamed protein product [Effrenium voratum]
MAGPRGRVGQRLQETLLRYGQVGLVVHFCLSSVSLVSCFFAVRHQLPVEKLLDFVGASPQNHDDSSLGLGSSMVMAFVLHKAIMPLRVPVTVAVTPLAASVWARLSRAAR